MMPRVVYPEILDSDTALEADILTPHAQVSFNDVPLIADLDPALCRDADGLLVFRHHVTRADFDRFPKLSVLVRIGVGYDRIDMATAAERGILVCNVPDYGTTEIADHAMGLILSLRRGLLLHHDLQRGTSPAPWLLVETPLIDRLNVQTLGIIGLGRIGTALAMRAKAFGLRVVFYDPYVPNGVDLALGIERARALPDLLRVANVLSLNCLLSDETRGMIGAAELAQLPRGAIIVNTARGAVMDIEALEAAMRAGHVAGAGLDVIPVEPPVEPLPGLLRAYRECEDWLTGRLIVTPHVAYYSAPANRDIRVKAAETMVAALQGRPQNVVLPAPRHGRG
ncbi:C-terminal binding protein [Ancylobacter sp.]|uniref:C-terminal binding protein n=1 Tax=Ancylobacter sp. TaxID=1872567 RepID=UPI003BA94393